MERKNWWLLAFLFVTVACVLAAGCVSGPVEDGGNVSEGGGGQPAVGAVCGDAICDSSEDCSSCASDCGVCPPVCGDGTCDSTEDCTSCSSDCGACPVEEPESNETEENLTGLEGPCIEHNLLCQGNSVYECISNRYILSRNCREDQVCEDGMCKTPVASCGDGTCNAPDENSLNCPDDCSLEVSGPSIDIKTAWNTSIDVCFYVRNVGDADLYEEDLLDCDVLVDGGKVAWYRPEKGGETFTRIRVDKHGETELCLCSEPKDESVFPTCDEDYNEDLERAFFPYEVAGQHITITFVNALNGQTDSTPFWSPAN